MMKLKPCHVCGSQNILVARVDMPSNCNQEYWSAECLDCGDALYEIFKTKEEAENAWGKTEE